MLNQKNIGREDYRKADIHRVITGIKSADSILDSLYNEGKHERAFIVGNYLNEMKLAIDESIRVLKKNSYMIIIIIHHIKIKYQNIIIIEIWEK